MYTFEDPPVTAGSAGSASTPSGPPWPGPGGPAGPYGTAEFGAAGGPGGPARRHRGRLLSLTAVVAMAVGAGSAWAVAGTGAAVLTTSQIVAKTNPAVVDVVSTLGNQDGTSSGTGIVLTSSGEVLTNNHVIDGATSVRVRDVGGRTYTAAVVGYSETRDIAVLQLKGASGLATADLGDSSAVKTGQKVVAVGNAGGQDGVPSVATGTVTSLNRSITASDESAGTSEQLTGLIQTNAGIQPGDSGGPLINTQGKVIGLDTAASASGNQLSSSTAAQAFTIPINEALRIASQIESGQSSATVHIGATAFLGVAITSPGATAPGFSGGTGAQIAGVGQGSAAAGAGLAAGDTITSLGGRSVSSSADIRLALSQHHPGDTISVTWTDQSAQSHSGTVVLTAGPAG